MSNYQLYVRTYVLNVLYVLSRRRKDSKSLRRLEVGEVVETFTPDISTGHSYWMFMPDIPDFDAGRFVPDSDTGYQYRILMLDCWYRISVPDLNTGY